jgi:hypothetical protein
MFYIPCEYVSIIADKHVYQYVIILGELYFKYIWQFYFKTFLLLTPCMHICKSICHYCVPVLETCLRMAMVRPRHVGGTS